MRKKRALAVSSAVAMSILLLAGCRSVADVQQAQSGTKAEAASGETASGDAAQTTADGKPVYKYRMAMYNEGPWHVPTESLEYYKKLFPDLDIELVYVEKGSAEEKMNLMISSGDIPDVMQFGNRDMLYEQGVYGSWTEEFFREHAPNISKMIDETDPMAWEYAKYDGENMYSIPGWNVNRTYPFISVWNKDWLDAVGEEVPTTLEDAERVFYKFANDDPDGNGKKDTYGLSASGFMPVFGAFGTQKMKDDGTIIWLDDGSGNLVAGDVMPQAKEALRVLNKWYKDGVIDPEFITGEAEGGYWALSQPLNKGKIGFTTQGWFYHWSPENTIKPEAGRNVKEFKALNPESELAYGIPLTGPDGKAGHLQEQPMVLRTHFSKALTEDKERFGRLLEFIDYVNGSDMAGDMKPVITNVYGIEGEEWEYGKSPSGNKDVIKQLVTEQGEMSFRGWTGTFTFVEEGGSLEFQKIKSDLSWADEITKDYPESYVNQVYTTLESAGKYKAEQDKLLKEGYISIITGEQPIDYFDELVELWYQNGGTEMTEEANEWYHHVKELQVQQ